MHGLTRRQSIAALLGGGAAVGVLALGVRLGDEDSVLKSIIRQGVGPFQMNDSQFAMFVQDLQLGGGWADSARFGTFAALSMVGDTVASYAPKSVGQRADLFERKVVSNFITRTDYLKIDPARDEVSFTGDEGCSSPFAKFDLA